jgi:hypothetical protein
VRWSSFRAACPPLADLAAGWIAERHILMLGTVRVDGSPRISAVECDVVDDDLCSGMIWQTRKALDLVRDPRLTVHSLPPGLSNPEGDVKLYGVAVSLEGPDKRAYERVLHERVGWSPTDPYHCFAYDITSAGLVRYRDGGRDVWRWREGRPLRQEFEPDVVEH